MNNQQEVSVSSPVAHSYGLMPASQDSLRLIEGTATYRGMASFLKTSGYLSSSQWIHGEVMLNANFDNSTTMGTISGNIQF